MVLIRPEICSECRREQRRLVLRHHRNSRVFSLFDAKQVYDFAPTHHVPTKANTSQTLLKKFSRAKRSCKEKSVKKFQQKSLLVVRCILLYHVQNFLHRVKNAKGCLTWLHLFFAIFTGYVETCMRAKGKTRSLVKTTEHFLSRVGEGDEMQGIHRNTSPTNLGFSS